ncbi:uncharacterized protein KNAG_0J02510 [Huiozyma naganishii CBS 8797]|uniref:Thioesterase domain-containing protein n=1 Tax=Huiozyma naganishii (strain ATCC MYA-139 / BCRC 22969 / CBS 8797 / KCTC 17520 / NBRC 10181 / NCYC 3082 / Yp74L-3) TaxID=1071383 RepID=J7RBQ9_HUIN7|nr:hypothetical protein KNAG_0J02510 [Kazachstania naganishii CBS 8797]CCK72330.1 hypothetical protein KNAG_0J02510 [Kazachstania naganishii CBS 8797]
MTLFNVFKWFCYCYLLSSYKSLPSAYFFRFYYYVIKNLIIPCVTGLKTRNIKKLQDNKYGALGYTVLSSYVCPFDCDFYMHKSNSTYFTELDISRTDLMSKVFQKLFLESKRYPYVPVANVFTEFMRELKPFQPYNIVSSILCWDQKWIFVISRFMTKNNTVQHTISVTKYVLKNGRITISPREALEYCGIYNETVAEISAQNYKLMSEDSGFHNTEALKKIKLDYVHI